MKKKSALTFLMLIFLTASTPAQPIGDIIRKSDELMRGKSSRGEMTMTITKPEWTRQYSMKVWSLGTDYSMVLVTQPVKDKGNITLLRKKEVWNYLPTINKEIKIPASMMLQNWMGSDFTNDDLVKQSSIDKDYRHRFMEEEMVDGKLCWKIELIPTEEAAIVWGKVILWISKEGYFQLKSEFFDEDGHLVRIMRGKNIKNVGNRVIPTRFEIEPVDKPGNLTVMEYSNLFFDEKLDESFFTLQNMRKVK